MKKNSTIFVLALLFIGVSILLDRIHFWSALGLTQPKGLIYQGVLFFGLLWLLQIKLFEPYAKLQEARKTQTILKKQLAQQLQEQADALLAEYQSARSSAMLTAKQQKDQIVLQATVQSAKHISLIKEQARNEYETMLVETQKELHIFRQSMDDYAKELSVDVTKSAISLQS